MCENGDAAQTVAFDLRVYKICLELWLGIAFLRKLASAFGQTQAPREATVVVIKGLFSYPQLL